MLLAAALLTMQAAARAEEPIAPPRITPDPGCRPGPGGEIVVCGRRGQAERYRIPEAFRDPGFDPKGEVASVSRERNGLMEPGDAGIGSCSTVGAGGWTGCGFRDFKRMLQQEGK